MKFVINVLACIFISGCHATFSVTGARLEDEKARLAIIENDKSLKKAFAEIYRLQQLVKVSEEE